MYSKAFRESGMGGTTIQIVQGIFVPWGRRANGVRLCPFLTQGRAGWVFVHRLVHNSASVQISNTEKMEESIKATIGPLMTRDLFRF